MHADISAARDTIGKIRRLERDYGFHVALAHDAEWIKRGEDSVLMSLLDEYMMRAAKERIPNDEIP